MACNGLRRSCAAGSNLFSRTVGQQQARAESLWPLFFLNAFALPLSSGFTCFQTVSATFLWFGGCR